MAPQRQLASIMFADIVGYSALMQEDEGVAITLRQKLKGKLEEEVSKHGGRILEFRGDGALVSFSSTIESIRAALALQLDMQTNPTVPLRIGMHTGDVVIDDNSVYGDGVNIASRLESFAIPGSIFISGKVYDDIKNQKDIQTVSLGKYTLKNIKEQVEIFAISNPGIRLPDTATLQGKGEKAQLPCVLVLPFVNLSNDPDQEYFSDGLTEELISHLSRLKNIRVISRTTTMLYKGTKKDVRTIAAETGCSYIMEGSVRKQGNNLRITAQFIDAQRDTHLWADNFRGSIDDIFDIQENVSLKIVEALRMQLTGEIRKTLHKRYTDNSEAYQLYLQGRFFWNKRNAAGLSAAAKYFEKAIEKDPEYALAWAGLADTYSLIGEYTNISRTEVFPKQLEAVNKALDIDPQLGEAHISLAIALMLKDWDWKNSFREFRIGIELSPNYATGHHWYAEWLLFMGRTDEAFREISLAVELDPTSQGILKDLAIHYYYTRQYDKAIEMSRTTLELDPGFAAAHRVMSMSYEAKGMYEEAIRENRRWGEGIRNPTRESIGLAHIYASSGRQEEARKIIENEDVVSKLRDNDCRAMALVFAALGEIDRAFEWLEKSYERHEEALCSIKVDPKVDALRPDPRFNLMLEKIGMGEETGS